METKAMIHVIVATAEWGKDQLRYRRHRLAEFLAAQEETKEVIWVCPAPRSQRIEFQQVQSGIRQYAVKDLLQKKMFRFGRYTDVFYKHKLAPLLEELKSASARGERCCLWYTFPGFPLLSSLYPWDQVIYDCSDLWAAPISGRSNMLSEFRRKVIKTAELRIIERADSITCSSEFLRNEVDKKLTAGQEKVHTVENGVEYDLFSEHKAAPDRSILQGREGAVLGFIGGIKPKLDFKLIEEAALRKPDWTFLWVGPDATNGDTAFQELLKLSNVIWTGPADPKEVPHFMELIDIGIMPYKKSSYNQAVFPLKLFEFLAAGKPVVGSNLPSTSKMQKPYIYEYMKGNDHNDFIAACEKVLEKSGDEAYKEMRRNIARTQDWNVLFKQIMKYTGIQKHA
ncbi:glycosyltransferase family 1 protein [Bacillus mojavensis]|uniref:teichuronic acid biosynthesis protein TuaH n=1 Tax=Bacillus mojavensis TaxID=72360 RepID=UPI002DB99EA4|nr:glycosyltransferase family 1 protein [Bacillus mojavensis]MEC1611948.1 glycosyltransferase family 1 protein [Bacillus mojavensis]MEC1622764.1 glycosyltransferase family 1 protein [Bacillus mojavensis]MEC1633925.1 glycosyltransferase family 1 protein [Bacillus mojavensis]MEC1659301.1 glycosyltransferase family 1 protein [Bacillus mojavensis]MEC1691676.1 glycosyltransferase family 1 protein [Bacillus mojavensis]